MIQFIEVILIALFIEAVVNALKPIWTAGETKLTVSEYVSMAMGILLAVACKINMLSYIVEATFPVWVEYIFFVMTGIAIGRGTNFLYDLWNKLKEWQTGKLLESTIEYTEEDDLDLNIDHWPTSLLKEFCYANGVDVSECVTHQDYIEAIEKAFPDVKEKEPPTAGGTV